MTGNTVIPWRHDQRPCRCSAFRTISNRLYTEARAEVKDLDAVFERVAYAEPTQNNAPGGTLTMPAPSGAGRGSNCRR